MIATHGRRWSPHLPGVSFCSKLMMRQCRRRSPIVDPNLSDSATITLSALIAHMHAVETENAKPAYAIRNVTQMLARCLPGQQAGAGLVQHDIVCLLIDQYP